MTKPSDKESSKPNLFQPDWPREGEQAFFISKWIGTMVRYFWFRGKRPFEELYRDKHSRFNFLIGYVLHLILVFTIVLLLVLA